MNENNAKTLDDLENHAKRMIDGEIETHEISSLEMLDRVLVLELANSYSLVKIGLLSLKSAAELKFSFLSEYRQFKTEMFIMSSVHNDWIKQNKDCSVELSKLAKKLSGKDKDGDDLIEIALSIIDKLTRQNVYLNLYYMYNTDSMSKAHAMQASNKLVDSLIERYGDKVPYAQQLEAFYRVCNSGKLAEMWEQLDYDGFGKRARHLPKKDGEAKGYNRSLNTLYKNQK